jgi:hypothetical protein
MKNKKGNILTENLIFIILNIAFIAIILLFIFSQMESAAVLEERYAKQIALMVDEAKPGMVITLDMGKAIRKAESEKWPTDSIVSIKDNVVRVQLREKGGYSYSFFNDVEFGNIRLNEAETGYIFPIVSK